MFRVPDPDALYPTPATIRVPVEEGVEEQEATLLFRCLSVPEFTELSREGNDAFLVRAIGGWSAITDQKGDPIAFSPSALSGLLRLPYFVSGAIDAYLERFSLRKNW